MSKFENYLNEMALAEMPIPQDWDKSAFKQSFAKQLKYAQERAKQIGSGSSRVAFIIPFEGRETVLKIAKNPKGLAQNEVEADYGLHQMHGSVLIPLIDHDEDNEQPTWIHFEKAEKLTAPQFKSMTGFKFQDFGNMLQDWQMQNSGKRSFMNWKASVPAQEQEKIEESELFEEVTNMVGNFGFLVGDFTRLANWGTYKGKPVIIDYGFNEDIQKAHYSR